MASPFSPSAPSWAVPSPSASPSPSACSVPSPGLFSGSRVGSACGVLGSFGCPFCSPFGAPSGPFFIGGCPLGPPFVVP